MAICRSSLPLLLLGLTCCGGDPLRFPEPPVVGQKFASLVPLRALHFIGPDESPWDDYEPTKMEDTARALQRMRALGARQVVIEAPYAWTAIFDETYTNVASGNVVYGVGQPGEAYEYSFCQSGAFEPRPYRPPDAWINRDLEVLNALATGDGAILSGILELPAHTSVTATFQVVDSMGETSIFPSIKVTGTDEAGGEVSESLETTNGQDPLAPQAGRVQFRTITKVEHAGLRGAQVRVRLTAAVSDDKRAKAALTSVMGLAKDAGLGVILYLRNRAVPASATECRRCQTDRGCMMGETLCVPDNEGATVGTCRTPPGNEAFLDPSNDRSPGFGRFFAAYRRHVEDMAGLAAQGGAALLVIGGGSPYLSGSGGAAATFADGSSMAAHRAELSQAWRDLAKAARAAAQKVTPDRPLLLSYAAQNAFFEGEQRPRPPMPEWGLVDFWSDLDAVSIELILPGRPDFYPPADSTPREARELLRFMRTTGLAAGEQYGNLAEIGDFAAAGGHTLLSRPVLLLGDRAPAVRGGAAQVRPGTTLPLRLVVDFDEQARFVEATVVLVEEAVQRGLVGGVALSAAPGLVLPQPDPMLPSYSGRPGYGGRQKAQRPPEGAERGGFSLRSDYFGLLDTPAEDVLKKFWCPLASNCLSSDR